VPVRADFPVAPTERLAAAVALALAGRPRDPDAWLAMSLLVDSRIVLDDGSASDGMSWLDAERTLGAALAGDGPLRLYNRFAREFGDGYSAREDLPEEHRAAIRAMSAALARAPGVKSVGPRTPRAAAVRTK
jgi:hypothetical protein